MAGWADMAGWSDTELAVVCREEELVRRHTEGRLIMALVELERRQAYLDDGFRCLAGWGRAVQRWSDIEARSRRDLTKLATSEPVIVERLLAGQIGVAHAHLLGRLSRAPRVGQYVPLFLDEFLDRAAVMSYADFEQYVRNWRLLADHDGPDPARAHRDRSAVLAFTDHEFRFTVTGPSIDGAHWKALLHQLERLEWERDWDTTVSIHGDLATPSMMPRTSTQRRYDAFSSLLNHIGAPAGQAVTPDPDTATLDTVTLDDVTLDDVTLDDVTLDDVGSDETPTIHPELGDHTASTRAGRGTKGRSVGVTVNIVIDARTFTRGIDELFNTNPTRRIPTPFGPDAAVCQTFDGTFITPRDAVLAALTDKCRVLLAGTDGHIIKMSTTGRLFTGPLRDAILATATRCTHPGCLVANIDCHIDHATPHSRGGPTSITNTGGPACRHHNNWRYTTGAHIERHPDGAWATYRPDGTRIAPPDR